MSFFQHNWNPFKNKDPTYPTWPYGQHVSSSRPDTYTGFRGNDKTLIKTVLTRIANDCASIDIEHIRLDDQGRFKEAINSNLNKCLNVEANIDQSGREFRLNLFSELLDTGYVAIVPTETNIDPSKSASIDILSLRIATVREWWPKHVKCHVYNQDTGQYEDVVMPKSAVAIVTNPFYAVMNADMSTARRLVKQLNIMDVVTEQATSGKLDLIVQLPYSLRNTKQKQQAKERREAIETQLAGSKYGIAYIDATEKITQLNRSLENNLIKQIEYLTKLFYDQVYITEEIMNGTANEETMINYYKRTVEPIVSAVVCELRRKFLSKTARAQGQDIYFFQDPFKLMPVSQIADIADRFTRNAILSANEIRGKVGFKPVDNEQADELKNNNISPADGQTFATTDGSTVTEGTAPQEGADSTAQPLPVDSSAGTSDLGMDEDERQYVESIIDKIKDVPI